jgi:hypothetical protein
LDKVSAKLFVFQPSLNKDLYPFFINCQTESTKFGCLGKFSGALKCQDLFAAILVGMMMHCWPLRKVFEGLNSRASFLKHEVAKC